MPSPIPSSLSGRLLLAASVTTVTAGVGAWVLGHPTWAAGAAFAATGMALALAGLKVAGQHRLVEELQAHEERFRAILDTSAEGISVTDLAGRHLFANRSFCHMFGYDEAELATIGIDELTHADDRVATDSYRRRLKDGDSDVERIDKRYVRKDGSEFWGRATVTVLRGRDGSAQAFVGVISDVTDSRRLEEVVRQSEERLRLATRAARIGIVDWDLRLNQGRFDRVFDELHGTTLSHGSQMLDGWLGLMHPQDRTTVQGAIETALMDAPEFSSRYRIQHPRFGERHLQIQGRVQRDKDNRPLRIIGVVWDVTERIAAEQALEEALASADRERRQAQHFLNVAGVMMVALDTKGCITLINASGCSMLGWSTDELEGRDWFATCIAPDRRSEMRQVFDRLMAGGAAAGAVSSFENEVLTRSGERRVCAFRNTVLHDESGVPVGTLSSAMDITELRRLNESLAQARDAAEAASHAKAEFLAMMSHEIRTPLNGVLGLAGMLLDTHLDAAQRELVDTLRTCGDSLLVLISDILDFSKIEAGRLELEEEEFDLHRTIDDAVALVAERIVGKDLELGVVVSPGVPERLRGDQTRLRQVFANLLSNAVKFTTEGGITVRVARMSTGERDVVRLMITVADTGIGIAPESQVRLFQVFAQAERSTTRKFGGTGLGLAICRLLVERMGGRIAVDSVPGSGTTFRFDVRLRTRTAATDDGADQVMTGRALVAVRGPILRTTLTEQLAAWHLDAAAIAPEAVAAAMRPGLEGCLLVMDDDDTVTLELAVANGLRPIRLAAGLRTEGADILPRPLRLVTLRRLVAAALGGGRPTTEVVEQAARLRGHLLVAEDNPVNQRVILAQIARLGCTADLVADGNEAIAATARRSYDLVLMDCQMPECDGMTATTAIRRREAGGRRMPIIALTAGVTADERAACRAAGMDEVLGKPVRREALGAALARWLQRSAIALDDELPLADAGALKRLQEDAGDLDDYRQLFRVEAERQVSALTTWLTDGDLAGASATAHRLKSSSTLLGARRLTARLLAIEEKAKTGDLEGCRSLANGLVDLVTRSIAAIDALATEAGSPDGTA